MEHDQEFPEADLGRKGAAGVGEEPAWPIQYGYAVKRRNK
jgi:hypothetical protein